MIVIGADCCLCSPSCHCFLCTTGVEKKVKKLALEGEEGGEVGAGSGDDSEDEDGEGDGDDSKKAQKRGVWACPRVRVSVCPCVCMLLLLLRVVWQGRKRWISTILGLLFMKVTKEQGEGERGEGTGGRGGGGGAQIWIGRTRQVRIFAQTKPPS